jgi:carbonic anhydrase/acetyltransferase-like protein (isoleucine patch superfamily)
VNITYVGCQASDNYIKMSPVLGKQKMAITFYGKRNTLIVDESVAIGSLQIDFIGHDATVHIHQGCAIHASIKVKHNGSVTLKPGVKIRRDTQLVCDANSHITIGPDTRINARSRLCAYEGGSITIGARCLLADVRMRTSDSHSIIDLETGRRINPPADIYVEDQVWLAENVYLYKGAHVGSGSVVAGRSTVTGYIPPYSLAAGTPAHIIKTDISWNEKLLPVTPTEAAFTGLQPHMVY